MAAKSFVQVPADSTGKKVCNAQVAQGADTVDVQGVFLADTDDDGHILRVAAAGVLQAIPNALTELISGDCKVEEVRIVNPTASPVTFTVQDGSGTPRLLISELIAPGSFTYPLKRPKLLGGLKWQASASGCWGYVIAYQ